VIAIVVARALRCAGRGNPGGARAPCAPFLARDAAQAVHRLQVGLFGLGAILLLISLANVIMERAELISRAAALDPTAEASATTETANDPLVDMGVAPELPVGGGSAQQPPQPQPQQQQPSQQQ
jgi:hypothetical protein